MRLRFIETASTVRQCFVKGHEYDLENVEAADHLRSGHAVEVKTQPKLEAAKPEPKPEPKPAAKNPAAAPAPKTK